MIIFDLDGTLADCEHRRHFIDRGYREGCNHWYSIPNHPVDMCDECKKKWKVWKPNWQSFYEACDQDKPIGPVIEIWNDKISLGMMGCHQIWTGRCESVREKTEEWLNKYLLDFETNQLKMRPIGDNTPDDQLKEQWLDDRISDMGNQILSDIQYVFDSDPQSIIMWRRRGIFAFNCAQCDGEF